MKSKLFKPLLTVLTIYAISMFTVSCGDDDIDCDKALNDIIESFERYDNALENGDCEDLDDLFGKVVKSIRKAKSCPEVKDGVEEDGFDSVEDFIDALEADHQEEVDECNAPA